MVMCALVCRWKAAALFLPHTNWHKFRPKANQIDCPRAITKKDLSGNLQPMTKHFFEIYTHTQEIHNGHRNKLQTRKKVTGPQSAEQKQDTYTREHRPCIQNSRQDSHTRIKYIIPLKQKQPIQTFEIETTIKETIRWFTFFCMWDLTLSSEVYN